MNQLQIDKLVYQAVFGPISEKSMAQKEIYNAALDQNIIPASIHDFYMNRGSGNIPATFSVPAMNFRGMTYDLAKSAFKVAVNNRVKAMIFELARSEMVYTDQSPAEYVTVIMAAAIHQGWAGPLFIQGDHFQAKAASPGVPILGEIESIKQLIIDSINAGIYNIDIDMSTLVDLSQPDVAQQQATNISYSLEMIKHIRAHEPAGVTISIGGEVGHIGGVNSTVEDVETFLDGINQGLPDNFPGISKISVNTGTSHGGVVLEDGKLANISIDFSILQQVTQLCVKKYQIGGSVQHGASTLPDEYFDEFVKSKTLEVHLATGFQNIQMDHPAFPEELLTKMYSWLDSEKAKDRKPSQTDQQFHYELRKKAWGKFKKECWDIPQITKDQIATTLENRFGIIFKSLNVVDTAELMATQIQPIAVRR